jgi:Tol biopolymer transport system component
MKVRRVVSCARGSLPSGSRLGSWLALALCACGSNAVDVGAVPEQSDAGSPELVTSPGVGSGCSLAGLRDYLVVFDSDGGGLERRIYSMRGDGSELEALTSVDELAREPALSPDGKQLAYVTPEGLKLLDMASKQSKLLVPGADQPTWSGDGTLLAYRTIDPSMSTLTVRHMTDGVEDALVACNNCSGFDLTPDGSTLVYPEELYREGIVIESRVTALDLTTYALREVVARTPIRMTHPSVSSDGTWVAMAFECEGDAPSSLWVSPAAVATPPCEGHRTTPAGGPSVTNPSWGPGAFIAYERGEPPRDIAIVSADTGEECVIKGPGDDRNPSWGVPTRATPQ